MKTHWSNSRAIIHGSTQFRMVKSGPAWFPISFLKGCISGCRSPKEMGVKSTVLRNNHSLKGIYFLLIQKLSSILNKLFYECIIFWYTHVYCKNMKKNLRRTIMIHENRSWTRIMINALFIEFVFTDFVRRLNLFLTKCLSSVEIHLSFA